MGKSEYTINISKKFLDAVLDKEQASGFTHTYYLYPARFSPNFARQAIIEFTEAGDVVIDPFMGSGTVLVEAMALGRNAIGTDVSALAHFITQVKTTILTDDELDLIAVWLSKAISNSKINKPVDRHFEWAKRGYQKDLPWRLRKIIELLLNQIDLLENQKCSDFVRCALLQTGKWAIDNKLKTPSVDDFRDKYQSVIFEFIEGMKDFRDAHMLSVNTKTVSYHQSATELKSDMWNAEIPKKPKLVVTSPPYPGVKVIYHRWQVKGRRETPAPFWIADRLDGHGGSYYTMGSQTPTGIENYFNQAENIFRNLHELLHEDATVVQLIAFSDMRTQLPRYLTMMQYAGFTELKIDDKNPRIWRDVPLRKWYASMKGRLSSAREVLLIHKRRSI